MHMWRPDSVVSFHARLLPCVALLMLPAGIASAAPSDLAAGALSFLLHRGCDLGAGDATSSVEWPTFLQPERSNNRRAAPPPTAETAPTPTWGPKRVTRCRLSPALVWEALAAAALWSTTDHAEIEANAQTTLFNAEQTHLAFKKVFGWDVPQRAEGGGEVRYTAKQLQALFTKLYLKPSGRLGEQTAQTVYNVVLRDMVTAFAREVAYIQVRLPKPQLAKLAKEYQAASRAQDSGFYGPGWLTEQSKKLLPPDPVLTRIQSGRTLGTILRRMNDGTWPTVVSSLKKLLKDYDPLLLKELGAGL
jgi:hypothetical protein